MMKNQSSSQHWECLLRVLLSGLRRAGGGGGGFAGPNIGLEIEEDSSDARAGSVGPELKTHRKKARKPVTVRKEFPETWLWTEELVK